jgi:malonyl-CoA/methylmalonyl-CoA synthetase
MTDSAQTPLSRAGQWPDRVAIVAPEGEFTYGDLVAATALAAARLGTSMTLPPPHGPDPAVEPDAPPRVALLAPPGWDFVTAQWAIWAAGGMVVPLATSHPTPELEYVLDDALPSAVVVHPTMLDRVRELADTRRLPLWTTEALLSRAPGEDEDSESAAAPDPGSSGEALMLYTSGTTGRPKGVVHTHESLRAQMESLSGAWGWTPDDHILLALPLHHVHGLVNVLGTALWNGARVTILPSFDVLEVWEELASGDYSLFMGVPTQYSLLLRAWDQAQVLTRDRWTDGSRSCRLMVSGSAALPVSVLGRWEEITHLRLLERYGMTEIGMALSNPLHGDRIPGHVGFPLPGVEIRLLDDEGSANWAEGEIQVRGPTAFHRYWRRPDATAEALVAADDGGPPWFATGDLAERGDRDAFRILGRSNSDILKTGGYKISALEIEEILRTHPLIQDIAVVGLPDERWGETVAAAVSLDRDHAHRLGVMRSDGVSLAGLQEWAKQRMAPYKVPRDLRIVDDLPRNALGKVQKAQVKQLFEGD